MLQWQTSGYPPIGAGCSSFGMIANMMQKN
jgi:hypothetical protein